MTDASPVWNDLIKLRDTTTDTEIKERCIMYLNQINTAAGSIVKQEADNWLNNIK